MALGRQQGGDVLEIAIAPRLPLQADQIVEADGTDADALDDCLDGARAHLLVRAAARDLAWIEEIEASGGRAQGEVGAIQKVLRIARVDIEKIGGSARLPERSRSSTAGSKPSACSGYVNTPSASRPASSCCARTGGLKLRIDVLALQSYSLGLRLHR